MCVQEILSYGALYEWGKGKERERERGRKEGNIHVHVQHLVNVKRRRKWLVGEMSGRIHPINISTACWPAYHNKTNTTI